MQQRTQNGGAVGVAVFNDHDRPPRRFAPGRACGNNDCGTQLSVYNDGYFCSLHTPAEVPRVWGGKVIWPRGERIKQ